MHTSEFTTSQLLSAARRLDSYSMGVPWSGCRLWLGRVNAQGYGLLTVANRVHKAHRVSYLLSRGSIPSGLCVCHSCDEPGCIEPAHLFLGTIRENNRDMAQKGRSTIGRTYGAYRVEANLQRPWRAQVSSAGVSRYLGYFASDGEATAAAEAAKRGLAGGA